MVAKTVARRHLGVWKQGRAGTRQKNTEEKMKVVSKSHKRAQMRDMSDTGAQLVAFEKEGRKGGEDMAVDGGWSKKLVKMTLIE